MIATLSLALLATFAPIACAQANSPVEPGEATQTRAAATLTTDEAGALENGADLLPSKGDAPLTEAELETYPDARGMPADVQHFIVLWHDCNHWLGEPPFDADRVRQIEQAVASLCPGIDALGRAVRERHAGNAEVLARIADYEALGQ